MPGTLAGLSLATACHDATGPGTQPAEPARLVLTAATPDDSLAQPALEIHAAVRDSTPITAVRVYVDSATQPTPVQARSFTSFTLAASVTVVVFFPPGPGRHVVTIAVTDSLGKMPSASLTRTVSVPAVDYAVTPLPALGGDARALDLHADGDVVGWVANAAGRKQPALWRGGKLTVVPVLDTVDVIATRVDRSGDVLLQGRSYDPRRDTLGFNYTSVRVWRADGTLVDVGPVRIYAHRADSAQYPRSDPRSYGVCCTVGDLNDRREVLASAPTPYYQPWSIPLDGVFANLAAARFAAASGAVLDSASAPYTRLAADGQMAGTVTGLGYGLAGQTVVTRGFALSPAPAGYRTGRSCDAPGRFSVKFLVDLDDAADAIVGYECTSYAYQSAAGGGVWLDRYVGATLASNVRLLRQGNLVASLDPTGAVYVWNAATKRTTRVRATPDGGVTIDGLGAVNAAGQVVVHGTSATTGKAGAFLLTPSAAP